MKIYNSLTRSKVPFSSLKDKQISMYVCGPTVYDEPHIGHARSAYVFDVIRRYLVHKNYTVTFIRNVTDVDDKIIDKARKEFKGEDLKTAVKKVAAKYLASYHEDMKALGIAPPSKEPKATDCVEKRIIQDFIQTLIDRGAAYQSGGDVYFDIKKAKKYGKLSNQSVEKMETGARSASGENKKDPLDFALWKAAKEDEPSWQSPWGAGRPGWHIECSAMSSHELGDEFDIHGGGIDLIFPHHENEIAQSEGSGKRFARLWMHNGLLTINGEKMAKSLGNFITIKDFISKHRDPDLLKLLFLGTHYRHPVNYSEGKIREMKNAYARFGELFDILYRKYGTIDYAELPADRRGAALKNDHKDEFIAAMDDDFNTPVALGALFKMVNTCNRILSKPPDERQFMLRELVKTIQRFGVILGLSFEKVIEDTKKRKADKWGTLESIYAGAKEEIEKREQLRKKKKYEEADTIRKKLEEKGIILKDTKEGPVWRPKG